MTTQRLKKTPISLRVSDETKRKLEELAAAENRTITNYIETMVDRLYDQPEKTKAKGR